MAYAESPFTEAGNATYMTNAHDLENFSVENSFLSPSKTRDDLVSKFRNGRDVNLKTPHSRVPFTDRQNIPKPPPRGEFTPLLKSAARNSILRKENLRNGVPTPAFLKPGYQETKSPALPTVDVSQLYGDETGSSLGTGWNERTPVPQTNNTSSESTPLAVLPKRVGDGVFPDQGNMMTLREQENVRAIGIS